MSIADDRIEDKDGPLWAEHYPKRYDRLRSKAVCLVLFYIIADRAQVLFPHGELSDQLRHACELFDVPRGEFYEIGKNADEE